MDLYNEYCNSLSKEELLYFNGLDYKKRISFVILENLNSLDDEKIFKIKELMLEIFDKNYVEFYISILMCKNEVDENFIVDKYAYGNYDINMFFQTGFYKKFWEIEAKILCKKKYSDLKNYLDRLFIWLQDDNWLGYKEIYSILLNIPETDFVFSVCHAVDTAGSNKDIEWIENIISLCKKRKIDVNKISDKKIKDILLSYWENV